MSVETPVLIMCLDLSAFLCCTLHLWPEVEHYEQFQFSFLAAFAVYFASATFVLTRVFYSKEYMAWDTVWPES